MSAGTPPPLLRSPAASVDLLVRGAHLLDPRTGLDGPGDVLVREGEVAEVGAPGSIPAPEGAEVVDGTGRHLVPAFVDPHVHLRVPGQEHKEDLDTGTRAAAAGGYCAVLAMPNTAPTLDDAPGLRSVRDTAARDAHVLVGFLPAITRGLRGEELTEMAELRAAGAVGFTDDGRPVTSAGMLRKALQYQRLAGGVLALHEEDPSLSGTGSMHEGEVSALLGVTGIPSTSESTMVLRDCALAEHEGGRIHIQHLSAEASIAALRTAKARGVHVSGEASPHHLLLTERDVQGLDTNRKMNPPVRAEADRQALIEGLRDGTVECIATDHAPHARDEKEVPFEQAPMGTTGLETSFAAIYTGLVRPGVLPLSLVVERMTSGLELFDLTLVPRIRPGQLANLTLLDLEAEWTAGEHGYQSRSANCCFDGRRLRGRVLMTIAAGSVVHRERAFALTPQEDR